MKKYFIKTYGCQMNIYDSERIAGLLEALGLMLAENLKQADLLIINSCSVRQAAEDKVTGLAQSLPRITYHKPQTTNHKPARRSPPLADEGGPVTILTGCWVGSARGERKRIELKDIKKRVPWVDFLLTTEEIFHKLPKLLERLNLIDKNYAQVLSKFEPKRVAGSPAEASVADAPQLWRRSAKAGNHAWVPISEGCDNFCAFCVVPYARGKEVNRSEKEILAEIKSLTEKGYREFTLLGQNVNSWKSKRLTFAGLLRNIHEIPAVEKISFLSANPFDFTSDLIDVLALPKINNYLHLPVQSGNDEILRKMNRRHTAADYLKLVAAIRAKVPKIEIGTDVIVGFPTETEKQFLDTVKLFEKIKFSVAYIAMYSERPGTTAAKLYPDDMPLLEKKRRHKILMEVFKKNKPKN